MIKSFKPLKRRLLKIILLLNLTVYVSAVYSQGHASKSFTNFRIGIDNSGDRCKPGEFFNPVAMDSLGIDFVVYHYRGPKGSIEDEANTMAKLGNDFRKAGLNVVVNVECGNWDPVMTSTDGHDWVSQPDNLHLFKFPPKVLSSLNQSDAVWGIQYDELEHSQITRNLSITINHPGIEPVSLAEPSGMDIRSADNAVYNGAKSLVDECKNYNTRLILTEHVWPVLFSNFARAGMTPVYKQMKENWSNVWAACATGACMQYNKELWACLDFWHYNIFPGHSPEALWSNLIFAYWAGVDKAYIESIGKHIYEITDSNTLLLKESGAVIKRFAKEYVPKNPRSYTFRDYSPEIAIIRFDDTEWGQGPNTYCTVDLHGEKFTYYWKDRLFGAYNLHTSAESEEWIKAWHTITHENVKKESLSWNAGNVYEGMAYKCFAPANSPVVFDDQVTRKNLKCVRLVFLCGLYISSGTLQDVASLVKENCLVVVTSKRFAPTEFTSDYSSGTKEFRDGKGKWIITDDMSGDDLKRLVKPWIGNDDEITLRFKDDKKIIMKIAANGNELTILKNDMKR